MNHNIKDIALIGIGGGGMNTLHQLLLDKIPVARFIAVNRNQLFLNASRADKKIKLNAPKNAPEVIIKAVKKHTLKIKESLSGMDAVVLVVGLGGLTGTYAAPAIARIAQGLEMPVWAVVVMPFEFEGKRRMIEAQKGFDQLKRFTVEIRQVKNQELIVAGRSISMLEAFRPVDIAVAELIDVVMGYKGAPDTLSKDQATQHTVLYNQVDLKAGQASCQKALSQKSADSLCSGFKKLTINSCCSFCGQSISETKHLIAGPSVFICNGCVGLCVNIFSEPSVNIEI